MKKDPAFPKDSRVDQFTQKAFILLHHLEEEKNSSKHSEIVAQFLRQYKKDALVSFGKKVMRELSQITKTPMTEKEAEKIIREKIDGI